MAKKRKKNSYKENGFIKSVKNGTTSYIEVSAQQKKIIRDSYLNFKNNSIANIIRENNLSISYHGVMRVVEELFGEGLTKTPIKDIDEYGFTQEEMECYDKIITNTPDIELIRMFNNKKNETEDFKSRLQKEIELIKKINGQKEKS